MLQKLTEEIAECYRQARECRERAKQSPDPATKEDFFNMERHWLSLARNYEFAERLSRFTTEVTATRPAVAQFDLSEEQRKRLALRERAS